MSAGANDMATHQFTFDAVLVRGRKEHEYEVEVTYTVTDGRPARLYGDAPHPAEDSEIEIVSVKAHGGEIHTTRDEDDRLYDWACDRADQDLAEYWDDVAEHRAELVPVAKMARAA